MDNHEAMTSIFVSLEKLESAIGAIQEDVSELRGQVQRLDEHVRGNGNPGLISRVAQIEKNCIRSGTWQAEHDAQTKKRIIENTRGMYAIVIACISGLVAIASAILGGMT